MMTTATLRGHVALVTGGSRGIGAAIVRALAEQGAAVAINYRERAGEADAQAKEITAAGGKAIAIGADVSQAAAVAELVQRATPSSARSTSSSTMPASQSRAGSTISPKPISIPPSR
ncbi:SDR family NAD(P)-dependent oxidoreductase [Bradyrhizobium sp. Leo121]|uniref:SDR family NAD(P)-dependent oxidoreductase n=1 Tax=Bradyrhizobium sp. Leo121 TaxID=1571195 RepID=UPI0032E4D818